MYNLLLTLIYVSFISLGLPDSLLGSAWPIMHNEINVPVSYAGIISMLIAICTVLASLMSDRLQRMFGTGRVTATSIAMTAVALFGFSVSDSFWELLLWAVPYGLGAGAVDSLLNNYVALHYKSNHMSWLHCMWGVGASISPYIMSFSLLKLNNWNSGYLVVSIIQIVLSAIIFISMPLWKNSLSSDSDNKAESKPLKFKEIISIRGALPCFITFFCYCSLELTTSLWASSYLVQNRGITPEIASGCASLFYLGITAGRAINGFLAMKYSDRTLIRTGLAIIFAGIVFVFIPFHAVFAFVGFVIIGIGCAPVYPCIIHMTPDIFGKEKSQAVMGVQIAFAYCGFCIMPPLFGFIANHISIALLPLYLMIFLLLMAIMHETVIKIKKFNV